MADNPDLAPSSTTPPAPPAPPGALTGAEVTRLLESPTNGTSHESFQRSLLATLLRFKEGDFAVRMPSELLGVEGKIADTFNEILSVSQRRAVETARVCRVVGKEGKLKERMRVPGAVGYNIRFGIRPDRLTMTYQLWDDELGQGPALQKQLRSLNKGVPDWAAVEAFNESGVSKLSRVRPIR